MLENSRKIVTNGSKSKVDRKKNQLRAEVNELETTTTNKYITTYIYITTNIYLVEKAICIYIIYYINTYVFGKILYVYLG